VDAAVSLRASTAAGALQSTLDDPDRDVRVAAARALGELAYGPASARLERIVSGKEIREADISEKIAVFEAYGRVAAEQAVPLLDKLLNGKGFLGKREPAEVRAAAALALGRIDASEAVRALKSAAREDDPVVRSAVNRAMRHEG
jgi:HEAT repeat protein